MVLKSISASDAEKRRKQFQFTRVHNWSCYTPDYELYHREADDKLEFILNGVTGAVLTEEYLPGLCHHLKLLQEYCVRFLHRFPPDVHHRLIKLCYSILTRKNMHYRIVNEAAETLASLLSHSRITRSSLVLDWKPFFELSYKSTLGKVEKVSCESLMKAAFKLHKLFPVECAVEMYPLIRQFMGSLYMNHYCLLALAFLPTDLNEEEHDKYGAGLWFKDLWHSFSIVEMNDGWGKTNLLVFAKLARDCRYAVDWTIYYEEIFTRILRMMNLTARDGKVEVGERPNQKEKNIFGKWIAYTYGGEKGNNVHLARLLVCLSPQMTTLNQGKHTKTILKFLRDITVSMIRRLRRERTKENTRDKIPLNQKITDSEVSSFVSLCSPLVFSSLYCSWKYSTMCSEVVRNMCALDATPVLKELLKYFYPAIGSVCEPHKLTQMLSCVTESIIYLVRCTEYMGVIELTPPTIDYDGNVIDGDKIVDHSGRWHVINILETLVHGIDINDIGKTGSVLSLVWAVFNLLPVVDYSSQSSSTFLTKEEMELSEITAKLPDIVDTMMDRIFALIENIGMTAPKSANDVEKMDNEKAKSGTDEKGIQTCANSFVWTVMVNGEKRMRESIASKVFSFVTSSYFENTIVARICANMIQNVAMFCPEFWEKYLDFICKKLKSMFTDDVLKLRQLDNHFIWYSILVRGLSSAPSSTLSKHKQQLDGIIRLLLKSRNQTVSRTSIDFLGSLLSALLTSRTIGNIKENDRPFDKWNPLKEWGKVDDHHTLNVIWQLPGDEEIETVKYFLHIMFDHLEILRIPEILEKDEVEKSVSVVRVSYEQIVQYIWTGDSEVIGSRISSVKLVADLVRKPKYELLHRDGSALYVQILNVMESLSEYMVQKRPDDVGTFTRMARLVHAIVDPRRCYKAMEQRVSASVSIGDGLLEVLVEQKYARMHCQTRAHFSYARFLANRPVGHLKKIHEKATLILTKLAFSEYSKVRAIARSELAQLSGMTGIQSILVGEVEKVMRNESADDRVHQAALESIEKWKLGTTENPMTRRRVYNALITMKEGKINTTLVKFEDAAASCVKVNEINYYNVEKKPLRDHKLYEECEKWFQSLPKNGPWAPYSTPGYLWERKKKMDEHVGEMRKVHREMCGDLWNLFTSNELPLRRTDLARDLLLNCEGKFGNSEIVKIAIQMCVDDRAFVRDRGLEFLNDWMKENKPKTKRIEWKCPERDPSLPHYLCGVRPGTLSLVYDNEQLPDTEEKWSNTVFYPKSIGQYDFPRTLSVRQPWSMGDPLPRGEMRDPEKSIVAAFSSPEFVQKMISYHVHDIKDQKDKLSIDFACVIQYVMRNYSNSTVIYYNIILHLKQLLESKKTEYQRCAADMFVGVVFGTRHYKFHRLSAMWAELIPKLDMLINNLHSEAEKCWIGVFANLFSPQFDSRHFFWLVESLIKGLENKNCGGRQTTVRFDLLMASSWRHTTIVNRVVGCAWETIPRALLESERESIARVFFYQILCSLKNFENDFEGIPNRFRVEPFDYWIEKFMREISHLLSSSSRSVDAMISPHKQVELILSGKAKRGSILGKRQPTVDGESMEVEEKREKLETEKRDDGRMTTPKKREMNRESAKTKCILYLRVLVESLSLYYVGHISAYTPAIINCLPVLLVYATDEDSNDKDTPLAELRTKTSSLVFSEMSPSFVREKYVDCLLDTLHKTFTKSAVWRLRVAVLKYLEGSLVSNLFVYSTPERRNVVKEMLLSGMSDHVLEVRAASANCLMNLVNYTYFKVDEALTHSLTSLCQFPQISVLSKVLMGICALIQAHPTDCPLFLLPLLDELCALGRQKNHTIKKYAQNALREFRRTHRDNWPLTVRVIGPQLAYEIENAGAPYYYT